MNLYVLHRAQILATTGYYSAKRGSAALRHSDSVGPPRLAPGGVIDPQMKLT